MHVNCKCDVVTFSVFVSIMQPRSQHCFHRQCRWCRCKHLGLSVPLITLEVLRTRLDFTQQSSLDRPIASVSLICPPVVMIVSGGSPCISSSSVGLSVGSSFSSSCTFGTASGGARGSAAGGMSSVVGFGFCGVSYSRFSSDELSYASRVHDSLCCVSNIAFHQCTVSRRAVLYLCHHGAHLSMQVFLTVFHCSVALNRKRELLITVLVGRDLCASGSHCKMFERPRQFNMFTLHVVDVPYPYNLAYFCGQNNSRILGCGFIF